MKKLVISKTNIIVTVVVMVVLVVAISAYFLVRMSNKEQPNIPSKSTGSDSDAEYINGKQDIQTNSDVRADEDAMKGLNMPESSPVPYTN